MDLMNTKEVSEYTHTPEATLRWWKHRGRGEGPRCFKIGRRVMYARTDVDSWLREQYEAAHDEKLGARA